MENELVQDFHVISYIGLLVVFEANMDEVNMGYDLK